MNNRKASFTKKGPGRKHKEGWGRKQTALKYPGTHREKWTKQELAEKAARGY